MGSLDEGKSTLGACLGGFTVRGTEQGRVEGRAGENRGARQGPRKEENSLTSLFCGSLLPSPYLNK